MDDKELMQAAFSDEAPAQEPEQQPEPAQAEPSQEQPRDEHGRFAPRVKPEEQLDPQQPVVQAEQPDPEHDAKVPSWRLRELREEREAAARRAQEAEERAMRAEALARQLQAAQQPPKPAPDMYAEPEAWQQHLQQQTQNAILRTKIDLSEDWARDKYGDEKVDAVIKWAEENLSIPERIRIAQTRNPTRELVKMYDEQQTLQQIGGDLNAFKQKVIEEALNDPATLQKLADKLRGVQTPIDQRPVVQIPPSLNKAPGGNLSHDGLSSASMTDADLYAYATR